MTWISASTCSFSWIVLGAPRRLPSGHPKEFAPTMHAPFRLVSYVIVALMAAAVLYAFYMSVTYWTGIGV